VPQLRVVHLPTAVGGNPPSLARAERELGLDSRSIVLEPSPYEYAADETLFWDEPTRVRRELRRWRLLGRLLREADVVHFNFGSPLTPLAYPRAATGSGLGSSVMRTYSRLVQLRDLPLLRRAGKAIFVTFQGDDARQGDACLDQLEISPAHELGPAYSTPELDRVRRRAVSAFERWADGIFALNPDLLRVLPPSARFLPYANVDPRDWPPSPRRATDEPPVVLHAPTDRGTKGTRYILAAFDRLRAEGVEFEPLLVEGRTHAEARAAYERADLLVDQLLYGWYGGVAVELMALGRPVAAYIRQADLQYVPSAMRAELPVVTATPDTVYDVLRGLLTTRRHELADLGSRSRAYVERWHDPRTIAAELKAAYESAVAEHGNRDRGRLRFRR
jgi:glycosyltransferase involved in cell wall biosynthesis